MLQPLDLIAHQNPHYVYAICIETSLLHLWPSVLLWFSALCHGYLYDITTSNNIYCCVQEWLHDLFSNFWFTFNDLTLQHFSHQFLICSNFFVRKDWQLDGSKNGKVWVRGKTCTDHHKTTIYVHDHALQYDCSSFV